MAKLETADQNAVNKDEIRRLKRELTDLTKKIYSELDPWQTVQVARHPERPMTTDYLDLVFEEFVELHGDKTFADDRAIRTGFAKLFLGSVASRVLAVAPCPVLTVRGK